MGKFIGCGETGRCWWVSVWSSWLKMVQRHPSGNVHGLLGNLSLIIKIKVSLRAMVVKLNCQTCRADMKEVMTWGKSKIEEIAFKNILIKYLACGGERYNVGGGGHPEQPMAQEQGAWVNPGRWGWMKPISHQGQQIGVTTSPCLIFFPAKVRLSTQRT